MIDGAEKCPAVHYGLPVKEMSSDYPLFCRFCHFCHVISLLTESLDESYYQHEETRKYCRPLHKFIAADLIPIQDIFDARVEVVFPN